MEITNKQRQDWTCNECGFQEYTDVLSEDDVHELNCSNCGGWEWHLEIPKL